jgi:hypothetical protein
MQPLVPVSTMLLIKAQVLPPDSEHRAVRIDYAVESQDSSFSDTANQRKHAAVDFMSVARDGEFKNAGCVTDTVSGFPSLRLSRDHADRSSPPELGGTGLRW